MLKGPVHGKLLQVVVQVRVGLQTGPVPLVQQVLAGGDLGGRDRLCVPVWTGVQKAVDVVALLLVFLSLLGRPSDSISYR